RREAVPHRRCEARRRRGEAGLVERRLLRELGLGKPKHELALAALDEVVLADDDLAAEKAAGAHHEAGDAQGRRIDEYPPELSRVVAITCPYLRVQLYLHRVPPRGALPGADSAGRVPARR